MVLVAQYFNRPVSLVPTFLSLSSASSGGPFLIDEIELTRYWWSHQPSYSEHTVTELWTETRSARYLNVIFLTSRPLLLKNSKTNFGIKMNQLPRSHFCNPWNIWLKIFVIQITCGKPQIDFDFGYYVTLNLQGVLSSKIKF